MANRWSFLRGYTAKATLEWKRLVVVVEVGVVEVEGGVWCACVSLNLRTNA